jgi:hypothetical protein
MMETNLDPVIDEVRQVRHAISERVGHDPARLVEYYMKLQEQYKERLLRSPEKEKRSGKSAA